MVRLWGTDMGCAGDCIPAPLYRDHNLPYLWQGLEPGAAVVVAAQVYMEEAQ